MAELYDSVLSLQEDEKCMSDLARSCGLQSLPGAQRAYGVAVPVIMSGLVDTSNFEDGAQSLLKTARSLRWNERSRPEELFGRTNDTLGEELVQQIFGDLLPSVREAVAVDAEVTVGGAQALLEASSLVGLATIAGSIAGEELDKQRLVTAIQNEREAVPGDPSSAAAASLESAERRDQVKAQQTAEAEQRAFIAAGAAAAVGGAAAVGATAAGKTDKSESEPGQHSNDVERTEAATGEDHAAPAAALPVPEPVDDASTMVETTVPEESVAAIDPAIPADKAVPVEEAAVPTLPAFAEQAKKAKIEASPGGAGERPATNLPDNEDDGGGKKGILVFAGVGLLALLGAGYFLFGSGGSETATEGTAEVGTVESNEPAANTPTSEAVVESSDTVTEGSTNPASSSNGDIVSLSIPMLDIENPDSDAKGTLNFDFNTVTGEVCYSIDSINIEGPYRSHIHAGEYGVKGGIVVDLGPQQSGAVGCVDNLPVDTNAILANRAGHYAELHDVSEEFTIRGQLSETISGDIVSLAVPMTDADGLAPDASGTLNFDFNTVTGEVCYSIDSINIEGPYRSHIHVGDAGVKGGIVVDLGPQQSGAVGCVDNLPVDTNAILANKAGHYAELHDVSEEFTIRGQLSNTVVAGEAGNAVPAVVDTEGGGARTVLEGGTIYLEGDVPDQATADELLAALSGVDAATPVVDNLRVVPGSPLPSGRVIIADAIFFDVASDDVKTIPQDTLQAITALANSRDDWILTVVGHTDDRGTDTYNLELSLRRAGALRDLLASLGVPDENLRVRGAGETAPIGDNSNEAGRAQNRRIEFEFTPKG